MPAALSPTQAIAYVTELSADVRAVAVLDADGGPLAGPPAFAAAAGGVLAAWPALPRIVAPAPPDPAAAASDSSAAAPDPSAELVARTPAGVCFAARSATHAVVAVAGPLSLAGPTALDVRAALEALAGAAPAQAAAAVPPVPQVPDSALERAIGALFAAS